MPGEEEPRDEVEAERRGLPDGVIYDDNGWSLIIESKIESPLDSGQLERHRSTAGRRGFTDIHILALVTELPRSSFLHSGAFSIKKWTELYHWLRGEKSPWAIRLAAYMEVLERKLVRDDYLKEGTLTVFAGIPFGNDEPYTYLEAKRVLGLAMNDLRKRNDLKRELGIDPERKGRPAITGKDGTRVWDFLRLDASKDADSFTEFPHLTLGVHQEQLLAIVSVPHGVRSEFRRNLLAGGQQGIREVFQKLLNNLNKSLGGIEGAAPWIEMIQRRYPAQRSEPIIDARLQFDLRTGFEQGKAPVKQQPQWLEAAYQALANKNSNLHLGVGANFRYDRCEVVHTPRILDHVAQVWIACNPLVQTMLGSKAKAAGAR